jgi:FkbH-like protein
MGETGPSPSPAIVVTATFTAEALEETLAFWLRELGFQHQIRFAPYNQVFQQLLDPTGLLRRNRDGLNVVLVRFQDWARFHSDVRIEFLDQNVRHLTTLLRAAAESAPSPILVCVCPASPDFLKRPDYAEFAQKAEAFLESSLREFSSVNVVTAAEINRLYPVPDYYDPHADELGHVPYTPEFFAALATIIARKLRAVRAVPYKVIAVDCDETLWRGVCGEDGPQGVRVEAGHRDLQQFLLGQREAGMLLCLCSKNNPDDVLETFRVHPEMLLRLEHFSGMRLNWEPKSANLRSLAGELKLGLESFILLDDNPAECAEVQARCPEAAAVALPADASEFADFLKHLWAFDRWSTTAEDRDRAALYAQEAERVKLEKHSANLEEFLRSLNLRIRISPMSPDQIPRVSQLTHRTNQMNFTTLRRTESELRSLLSYGVECLTVDVADRFGSYGLVGVVLFTVEAGILTVDSFLLSCRALGRGVEHRMLARLGQIARERKLGAVNVAFIPTARNRPAKELLAAVGARFEESNPEASLYRFPADYLAAVRFTGASPAEQPRERSRGESHQPDPVAIDFGRIARELREPVRILESIRGTPKPAIIAPAAPVTVTKNSAGARTDLEKRLAALWASVLNVPSVGIHDNFFDLGGHSLMAVQLLSLVRQTFDIDLSLRVVYSGDFTVAELAKAIELHEIEQLGAEQYDAILKEIESLSDEEVRALLEQEQNGAPTGRGSPVELPDPS